MMQRKHPAKRFDAARVLTSSQSKALCLLNEAWLTAHRDGKDVWQLAVEINQLLALGLSYTDLRCLLHWEYLQHAQERTTARNHRRVFRPLKTLALPKRTCFILTAKGREFVSASRGEMTEGVDTPSEEPGAELPCVPDVPRWDAEARQLWWGKHLVKKFHRPAPNQELVLAALEEEGWPPQIDDPLPRTRGIDPKVRLHDTIKALNRHQKHPVIHFGSHANGQGIRWSLLEQSRPDLP